METPPTLRNLLGFFLPLAGMSLLMTASHAIINSCLNRSERPLEMLAAYAVAMSLNGLLEGPTVMLRQVAGLRVECRHDWRTLGHLQAACALGQVAIGLWLAFTPGGASVFLWLSGGHESIAGEAREAYRWLIFVPAISGYRMMRYGLSIRHGQGRSVVLSMGSRSILMLTLGSVLVSQGWIPSASRGTAIYLFGMCVDFLISVWKARPIVQRLPHPFTRAGHTFAGHFQFFWPLIVTSWVSTLGFVAFVALLNHHGSNGRDVGVWETAGRVLLLLVGPCIYLHCVPLQYQLPASRALVRKFCLWFGLGSSVLMFALAIPPVGSDFLRLMVGVSPGMIPAVLSALLILAAFPFLSSIGEFWLGVTLVQNRTVTSLLARVTAVGVSIGTLVLLLRWSAWPGFLSAAIAFVIQAPVECLALILPQKLRPAPQLPAAPEPKLAEMEAAD